MLEFVCFSEWGIPTRVLPGQAPQIALALIAAGKAATTPVAIVENATLENERRIFTNLSGLTASALKLDGPAVLCIGDVFAVPAVTGARAEHAAVTQESTTQRRLAR